MEIDGTCQITMIHAQPEAGERPHLYTQLKLKRSQIKALMHVFDFAAGMT